MYCKDIVELLETLSPGKYACEWDNVGLLIGRKEKEIHKIMIALDATNAVVSQAIANGVDMLITHHPMIFSAIKQVNEDDFITEKVLSLAEYGICYYAMHTNFDAVGGMAQLAAGPEYLDLKNTKPIEVCGEGAEGMGRYGELPTPMTADQVADYVKDRFHIPCVTVYQSEEDAEMVYREIAVMPGSGKSELRAVRAEGYRLYLTGDFGHHEALDAMDMGICVIDATHYGLEHIFVEFLQMYLEKELQGHNIDIVKAKQQCPGRII